MPKGRPDKGYALTPQRETVIRMLVAAGGSLDCEHGLVVSRMRGQLTGFASVQALSMVIGQMAKAGLVKREVVGRRTYHLELVIDALAPEDQVRFGVNGHGRPVGARPGLVKIPDVVAVEIDYRKLADELLRRCLVVLATH